jgi:hypothetical protein
MHHVKYLCKVTYVGQSSGADLLAAGSWQQQLICTEFFAPHCCWLVSPHRSETCNPKNTKNTPMTNTCQLFQTPGIISVLQQLEGDGLSRFSPCELHQRLKGRTLWVIG